MSTEQNKIPTGTVEGLMEFLDFLIEKGYGTSSAITPWKSAANRVFEVVEQGKVFDSVDVRSLDMADYVSRFRTLALGTKLKQESAVAYVNRFEKAITAYRDYLDNQRLPSMRRVGTRSRSQAAASEPASPTNGNGNGNGVSAETVPSLVDYPFPLRSGQMTLLRLPVKLEKADAERLATFIRTLAFEPVLELTAGSGDDA